MCEIRVKHKIICISKWGTRIQSPLKELDQEMLLTFNLDFNVHCAVRLVFILKEN